MFNRANLGVVIDFLVLLLILSLICVPYLLVSSTVQLTYHIKFYFIEFANMINHTKIINKNACLSILLIIN